MKINKQVIFLGFILIISIVAYNLIPNFEREQFNPDLVEEISSGTITTTTNKPEENIIVEESENISEEEEIFQPNLYDSLLFVGLAAGNCEFFLQIFQKKQAVIQIRAREIL